MDPIGASKEWRWVPYNNSTVEIGGRQIASVSGGTRWGGGIWMNSRRPGPLRPADPHANDEHHDDIHDVTIFEWLAWTPLLVAILVLGVYPQLLFKVMDPAVDQLTAVFR